MRLQSAICGGKIASSLLRVIEVLGLELEPLENLMSHIEAGLGSVTKVYGVNGLAAEDEFQIYEL